MSITNGFAGVSNCYVFKSRLQEYAQKAGLSTPVYETLKDGPSHEPCFRSTVIVDNVRYDSLPGFFNRKAAEQSAAEIALMKISKSGNMNESISHPVHETGLCKNLLQEYAQKMNYAIPSYVCHKVETPGKMLHFSCTVEIGGIQYIGAAARTKKEAEIKAARTALLAIQSSSTSGSEAKPSGNFQLTVLPCKKKGTESDTPCAETAQSLKPKKPGFKKKWAKKKFPRNNDDLANNNTTEQEFGYMENSSGILVGNSGTFEVNEGGQGFPLVGSELNRDDASTDTQNGQTPLDFSQFEQGISNIGTLSGFQITDLVTLAAEVDKVSGVGQVTQIGVAEATVVMGEESCSKNHIEGSNQIEDGRNVGEGELVQRVER